MYVSCNLIFLRNREKKSQNEIADAVGIGRGSYSQYERGRSMPPMDVLVRLADLFHLSLDTLVRKNLAVLRSSELEELFNASVQSAKGIHLRILPISVGIDNKDNVEVVPKKARAGYIGGGHGDVGFISELTRFRLPILPENRKYRMFQIEGDSMYPIPDGAYILGSYVQNWFSVKENKSYIFITAEDIVFKTVTAVPNVKAADPAFILSSLNSLYAPYRVKLEEVLEIWEFTLFMSTDVPEGESDVQFGEVLNEIRGLKREFLTLKLDITAGK
ncbi:XRE family transcriptional regulator [Runella slithyformis]|uniref:Helix-turn-helix domain protein n=1 Tax=Runella slithyformis (strain ATCC 29530 / DSM 19594 / LMG 11500 / NCIMB 11436 / LSU 4) TaxID=761193 RepID=A0A7U3ZQ72_RUNSL|nr:LexA family transcriptional regulator [Runella slithyformis]AEI51293.1 helix-turn-helix domain protein [Runella slithyformis DSM 19594]